MSQTLHGTYLHTKKIIHCLPEIQIQLGVLYFYVLNMTTQVQA